MENDISVLKEGTAQESAIVVAPETSGLLIETRRSLLALTDRERDVLVRRLGFESVSQTLEEIASTLDVTRQRIKQIEARATKKWISETRLVNNLEKKIFSLLAGRSYPLLVAGVEAIDPWFAGVASQQDFFKKLVRTLCKGEIHIVEIRGLDYVGLLSRSVWENAVKKAKALLVSSKGQEWSEAYARSLVHELLPENASEFGNLLWELSSEHCHFIAGPNSSRTLISYGRGAEPLIEAILAESERPLHYKEIAKLASAKREKKIDPRRAHSAAASVGFLFAPGTYGLKRHVTLADRKMSTICAEAEKFVCSKQSGRQWHTSEILAELRKKLGEGFEELDKYLLGIALANSKKLRPLRKMVWTAASEDTIDQTRIDIHQAVLAIVKAADRPLSTREIKKRLTEVRGVSEFFQIFPSGPLIRLQPGVWGISGRDTQDSNVESGLSS